MDYFYGNLNVKCSKDGNLILGKFSDKFDGDCIVTKGLDGCIYIYREVDFDKLIQKLSTLPLLSNDARKLLRYLIGNATSLPINNGCILLPEAFKECLGDDVLLIGMLDKIEVWNINVYNQLDFDVSNVELNL